MTTGPDDANAFDARLDEALQPPAAELVASYFKGDGPFAAETFDVLGANDPYRITSDDLLAITLLNVVVRPDALRALLGEKAEALSGLLIKVPFDLPLWDATDADLQAASDVWGLFRALRGIDWVTAGKLLARKRPRLIPVFDSVVRDALLPPADRFWQTLRTALQNEPRRHAVEALRPPGLTRRVSTLRLLDVAIWMRHSDGTSAREEQRRFGLPVKPRPHP